MRILEKILSISLIVILFSLLVYIASTKSINISAPNNPDTPITLTKEELTWLANNKNLYVSVKPGWAPVVFLSENGEFRGISIDILKKIEQILGIRFNKIQARENIMQENADIIIAGSSPLFHQQSRFTHLKEPYLVSPFAIYSKLENEFKDLKSLEGKKVAIFRTGNVAKNLELYHPKILLYGADIAEEALEALRTGKVDAYIGNSIIIDYTIINQGFRGIKQSGLTPYNSEIYMATKSSSPLLASILNKAFSKISEAERISINDAWTLKLTKKEDINYILIFYIILIATLITLVLYNANRKLNKEIEQRKKVESSLIEKQNKLEATEMVIRQYSNDLKMLNETLEEKVIERTTDLEIEIEERKNTEKLLRDTQNTLVEIEKMASLGSLVAGVAHEVNTPLGVSLTAISHLREKSVDLIDLYRKNLMKRSNLDEYFEVTTEATKIIEDNLFRAAELIKSFKEVSVDQSVEGIKEINLLSYINQILLSLQPNFKKRPINIELSNITENIVLEIQAGPFSQVISNLILNSLFHGFDEKQLGLIKITAATANRDLILVYEDNGKGIPKENLRKIFEPFFTTKRGSGGSGLGMHIVYNIINKTFLGKIELHSEVNQGVKFEMVLPNCVKKV